MIMARKMFMYCRKCNKKLIERLPNGLFKFVFGRDSNKKSDPPVQILIFGSVKIRCFRKFKVGENIEKCNTWNIFDFFPSERSRNHLEDKPISDKAEVLAKNNS
jgi:hypothetical protein